MSLHGRYGQLYERNYMGVVLASFCMLARGDLLGAITGAGVTALALTVEYLSPENQTSQVDG